MAEIHHSSSVKAEIVPSYTVPLTIIGMAALLMTLFAGTFAILSFVVSDALMPLRAGSGAAIGAVVLAWFGCLRAWGTRRKFAECRLILEGGAVTSEEPCSFRIEDRGHHLDTESALRFSVSYQDRFRRVGGHKVYTHGPYVLDVDVSSELQPGAPFSKVVGQFTLKSEQLKIDRPDKNWEPKRSSFRRCVRAVDDDAGSSCPTLLLPTPLGGRWTRPSFATVRE